MPTYTEVNPGEDALLKCRISDKKGVCSWQKDNKVSGRNKALRFSQTGVTRECDNEVTFRQAVLHRQLHHRFPC